VAELLGADHTLCVEDCDVLDAVMQLTDGEMADVVIDTAAGSATTVGLALDLVRRRGCVIFAASVKQTLAEVAFYQIMQKALRVRGVRGHSYDAVEWAIHLIASTRYTLELMSSMEVGLADVDSAIQGTGGELDPLVIHAAVRPFEA
jgi:threonine dehydrogenase-like Zn-dependent dehydrogenase